MKSFTWDEEYEIGIEKFDAQHKKLLATLNNLYKAMEDKRNKVALAQIINDLLRYSKEHLKSEEECLLEYGYPDYENHKKGHKLFLRKMEQFCEDFHSEKFTLHFEIAVFLKNWILNHILIEDKQYTEFLRSKGVR